MTQERYTQGRYLRDNPTWHTEDAAWKSSAVLQMLRKHSLVPETICEVGCGAGEILVQLAQAFPTCALEGWDISPQAMQLAQTRATQNIRFFEGDFLQSEPKHADVLMALDVFEHVEDYFGFLRGLKGRSEYTLFHIPLDLSVQSVARGLLMRWREDVGHLHYFTRDTALAALEETGYEIIDTAYTAYAIDRTAATFKARLARWPRRLAFAASPDWAARTLGGFCLMVLAK